MDRSQKADLVAELKHVFTETSVVVVTRNLGLSVAQSTDLRLKMRDAGAQFKVAKNRLALIALEDTRYKPIGDLLKGPTALATSGDPVAAAKVAVDFAKTTDKFEIVGGAMGDTVLDVNGIKALAALPSLDELRATIVGLIQAPATQDRPHDQRAGRTAGPGLRRLRSQRGRVSVIAFSSTHDNGAQEPRTRSIKWLTLLSWSTSFPN